MAVYKIIKIEFINVLKIDIVENNEIMKNCGIHATKSSLVCFKAHIKLTL